MKPQVQTLEQIMAELQPATSQQTAIIDKQRAGLDAKYTGQQSALDATKAQSMETINTQATGRGMSFSGIPLDEQAKYLSTAYLPETAKLKQQQNAEDIALQQQAADIYGKNYTAAINTRQNQQSAVNQFNLQEAQNAFTASENEKNRQASAAEAAANRAATQTNGLSGSELSAWAANYVKGKQGGDKKISPSDYYNGFSDFYTQTGLGQDEYMAIMAKYVNTSHSQDYKLY